MRVSERLGHSREEFAGLYRYDEDFLLEFASFLPEAEDEQCDMDVDWEAEDFDEEG